MTSAPLWLCWYPGNVCRTVMAASKALAERQCVRRWGEAPRRVVFAGYSADERPAAMPKGAAKRRRQTGAVAVAITSWRVKHALELYDELRAGFPTPTTLRERGQAPWVLRDFIADMGALLLRCDPEDDLETAMNGDDAAGLGAALCCALTLIDVGYPVDDALFIANRTRRISVPAC